jgi:uncharacterized membrane protein required for colicin V production
MSIPMSWAVALAVAGAMGVVSLLGIAAHRGVIAAPERVLAHLAHLLGGGVAGFLALAFYPAWPLLAAVVGMLVIRAIQTLRILDIGLLMVGFGSAWTLVMGLAILNDLADPAVISTQDDTGGFVFAALILLAGLGVAIAGSAVPSRRLADG